MTFSRTSILTGLWFSTLIAVIFLPTFSWMVDRWTAPDSYYSHGFLIPFVSGFIVWKKKHLLREISTENPSFWAWIFMGSAFVLQIMSAVWRIYFTQALAFLLLIFGALLFFYSPRVVKKLLFPVLFLFFMIPMPLDVIAKLNLELKMFAADCAVSMVRTLGVYCVQDGSHIHFMNASITVGNVCSGLRSLISLLALGAIVAYLARGTGLKKILIFFVSFPTAVIANVARIVLLCLIANRWGVEAATGFFHDFSGLLIFGVAYLLLFFFESLLGVKWLRPFMATKNTS